MKSIIKTISESNRANEKAEALAAQVEINSPQTKDNRRDFLKKTAIGGISLGGLMGLSITDTLAQTTSNVKRSS
ncbi:MAG: twin-arginine translocation signal domain-containing protein, partial [Bacteroidetes bacterium]|nr:twin-arginine translocation signal domain-containing protein [Bacteroidota bacterium]